MPVVSADKMMWTAWDLQARLPGIGALLAAGEPETDTTDNAEAADADPGSTGADDHLPDSDRHCNGGSEDGLGEDGSGDGGPGGYPSGGYPPAPGGNGSASMPPPRLANLVLPLATLLGLAERPGEGHGLGPLDPDLCRELAIAAIGSPWTRLCVTVTDSQGIAIGHGCAKPARKTRTGSLSPAGQPVSPRTGTRVSLALPAQVNLTITAAHLAELDRTGPPRALGASVPPGQPPWSFTRVSDSGPPGGFGTWILSLSDGRQLTVVLEPMPTYECDHRHESHAYQPNDRLRHLVQVRDYACTFPPCNRHANESDFEHAVPYNRGGRTCGCNAGARSRACHQIKQSPGWKVTQPRPAWHQWETPSGRTYTQPPKRYPT